VSTKILGIGFALLVIAALVVAWGMGGAQPTRWIEVPLAAPTVAP
jgi:hypothetical protein